MQHAELKFTISKHCVQYCDAMASNVVQDHAIYIKL